MFLGLQSKNVNQSRIAAAFFTSIGISVCNLITIQVALNHDRLQIGLMMIGSGLGIVTSILLHDWLTKKKHENDN
jgi:purine-cytosine permease-like protein